MPVVEVLVGLVVLTLGRRLFWLFVGAVGLVAGITLATQFFRGQPDWVILLIALGAGLLGALLAIFLQQVAIGLAGFIGGGYIAIYLLNVLGLGPGRQSWLPFVIGGIIGIVLVVALFDWALIVLSSLTGASLIVQATHLRPAITGLAFILLFVVGVAVQASLMHGGRSRAAPPAEA
jgi:hypothetical protein